MRESKDLSQASPLAQSLEEGRAAASRRDAEQMRSPGSGWLMVPIRSLGSNHRDRITNHLLLLEPHDRYLRFGYPASDGRIRRYAESLDFERDEIFGIYNRKLELMAVAHLAYPLQRATESCAEFGVSVLKSARGRGFGARLFDRAAMHARNHGITQMVIHALSENSSMLNIARRAGAVVQREGSDSEAYLRLPTATFDSQMAEIMHEHFAQVDYRMKTRARQFSDALARHHAAQTAAGTAAD